MEMLFFKKYVCLLLALVLCLAVCSCNGDSREQSKELSSEEISENETSENSEYAYTATAYIPVENDLALTTAEIGFDGSAGGLIEATVKAGGLPEDIKVNFFRILNGVALIDLNKAYADYVYAGTFSQYYGIGCVVNTLLSYYGDAERVFISAEGEILMGAEGDLFYKPIGFYGDNDFEGENKYAMLYLLDLSDMSFIPAPLIFDGTPQGIIDALTEAKVLREGIKVNSFSVSEGVAYIDLSEPFGEQVYAGLTAELAVDSVAYSLLGYYGMDEADSVFISIDGEPYRSEYSGLDPEPIRFNRSNIKIQ